MAGLVPAIHVLLAAMLLTRVRGFALENSDFEIF
jgi:hypothetical protein